MGVERQWGKLKTPHKTRLFFFPGKWVMDEGAGQVAALPFGFFFFFFFLSRLHAQSEPNLWISPSRPELRSRVGCSTE